MKHIDLKKYPKFVRHCYDNDNHKYAPGWVQSFHIEGYKSAYNENGGVMLSDEDYFMFVLKWS
jgi:hypothetical protein